MGEYCSKTSEEKQALLAENICENDEFGNLYSVRNVLRRRDLDLVINNRFCFQGCGVFQSQAIIEEKMAEE